MRNVQHTVVSSQYSLNCNLFAVALASSVSARPASSILQYSIDLTLGDMTQRRSIEIIANEAFDIFENHTLPSAFRTSWTYSGPVLQHPPISRAPEYRHDRTCSKLSVSCDPEPDHVFVLAFQVSPELG